MKPQHFALLAVAAVLSLSAAVGIYTSSAPWSVETTSGGPLFPSLQSEAGKVHRIEISQGSTTLVLEGAGDQWRLQNRDSYPATPEKIRALLASLSEAVLAEPKTRNPQRYALLELEDPADKNANSRLVRLLDDKGAVIGEAIVGKKRSGGGGLGKGGTYVRKPGDPQTWLATADINGGTGLRDWAKARIFETAPDKITKLKIEIPGNAAYEIVRDPGGEHKLAEMPAGKKLKFVNVVDNIVEATAFMEFEDVRKAAESSGDVSTVALETESGLKVVFKFRRETDATWLAISAAGDGEAKKAADDIAQRTSGWEFKILPSKADATLKRRDDLLEDSSS
jgi:hypothetical protein